MPCPARNRSLPKAVNPASMELRQLLALPRQTLVLLASARHLVTTDSKARLAECIHTFEHTVPPPPGPIADVGVKVFACIIGRDRLSDNRGNISQNPTNMKKWLMEL